MKESFKILLVEDTDSFREAVVQLIGVYNDIDAVGSMQAAREAIKNQRYDVVILDKTLPDGNGQTLIREVKEEHPGAVVIMLTADSDFASVKKCITAGADDYVVKSPNVIPDLLVRIPITVARAASDRCMTSLERHIKDAFKYEIIGKDVSTVELREKIASLKGTHSHVLITGESGTGKELIARRLNAIEGGPKNRPFVAVNCSALPENLIESELFGHRKGAFTGAISDKRGRFEEANGGDIFLDEIGELPLQAQAKLLRVVQDGQYFRVGDSRPMQVECRVIAATNRNVENQVREGTFREDLYYRLNVVRIHTTPLRARKEDIQSLAQVFVLHCGNPKMTITNHAINRLVDYDWPGNIRELRNAIERGVIAAKFRQSNEIDYQDISIHQGMESAGNGAREVELALPLQCNDLSAQHFEVFLKAAERVYYREALHLVNDNAAELALRLNMGRSTIFKHLARVGIQRGNEKTIGSNKSENTSGLTRSTNHSPSSLEMGS